MKRILCIGASISNLVTAHHLSEKNEVHLIEIHAELGMPSSHPGFLSDLEKLSKYTTEDQIKFLRPYANERGWGLRSEWLCKHLAMNAAQRGVQIHTRTRIVSIVQHEGKFLVEYQGGGPLSSDTLLVDHIIDGSTEVPDAPGGRTHEIDVTLNLVRPDFGVTAVWFGGTALTTDCTILPEQAWGFQRAEGLSEVWFEGAPSWVPEHGWIEQIQSSLSTTAAQRTIDAQIDEGKRLAEAF
jgi:hypothetical protein